jgi:hypothetical protein
VQYQEKFSRERNCEMKTHNQIYMPPLAVLEKVQPSFFALAITTAVSSASINAADELKCQMTRNSNKNEAKLYKYGNGHSPDNG